MKPPLDADFFAQAKRLPSGELSRKDRDLFSFIRGEFGQGDLPTLEVFFTQVSAVDRFHREFNIRGRPSGKFGRHLEALRLLIPRVFDAALGGRSCTWHERIAAALRAGDAVMSFNYDTLMDKALKNAGGKRWNPTTGYGFQAVAGVDDWSPLPTPGAPVRNPIRLLKPHGSLNWKINDDARVVELVSEYSTEAVNSIVPPTWEKSAVTSWPWNEVWRESRSVLGLARILVVVGYSVPVTDQMSQALLRADVSDLDALVVVNPDLESRRRTIRLLSSALDVATDVVELESLDEFANHLPPAPTEQRRPPLQSQMTSLRDAVEGLAETMDELKTSHSELREELDELEAQLDE